MVCEQVHSLHNRTITVAAILGISVTPQCNNEKGLAVASVLEAPESENIVMAVNRQSLHSACQFDLCSTRALIHISCLPKHYHYKG